MNIKCPSSKKQNKTQICPIKCLLWLKVAEVVKFRALPCRTTMAKARTATMENFMAAECCGSWRLIKEKKRSDFETCRCFFHLECGWLVHITGILLCGSRARLFLPRIGYKSTTELSDWLDSPLQVNVLFFCLL